MTGLEGAWPRLFPRPQANNRRKKNDGTANGDENTPSGSASASGVQVPPKLPDRPMRPSKQLYEPKDLGHEAAQRASFALPSDQDMAALIAEQRRLLEDFEQRQSVELSRADDYGNAAPQTDMDTTHAPVPVPVPVPAKAPTSDRVAEFVLQIPDGVRNTAKYPGDEIVGTVSVTVTKPTRIQGVMLFFRGRQTVYLLDTASQLPIPSYTPIDYTMFDRTLQVLGRDELLAPGTLTVPFCIRLPRINYPATMRRDNACKVKYSMWATLDRAGLLGDRSMVSNKESIYFVPLAYPTGVPRPLSFDHRAAAIGSSGAGSVEPVDVRIAGTISYAPAVAGECVSYAVEARVIPGASGADVRIRAMRLVLVEHLDVRGLIRSTEQKQSYQTPVFTYTLAPADSSDAAASASAPEGSLLVFSAAGRIRLLLELCPFESKLLNRRYFARLECDVTPAGSLLKKAMRQVATYAAAVPLDVCTLPPSKFSAEALQNAYTDESLNVRAMAPPPHTKDPGEPEMQLGGWEAERSFAKWDQDNPVWIALAKKKR
ncbi:hypothetical protein GGI07_002955 [Coemansia sp. Benny D115]|nr:hypothetical protein GGI07_002955 [Coemansia sp. Benny D115]